MKRVIKRKDIAKQEAKRIADALMLRHEAYLEDDEWFEVSGYTTKEEAYTCVTLRNEDDSFYYPVECRVDLKRSGIRKAEDGKLLLLDFQDYYFGRYFEEARDLYITIDWGEFEFGNETLQSRGQVINRKLEKLADNFIAGKLSSEEVIQWAKKK